MIDKRMAAEIALLRKKRGLSYREMQELVGVSFVHLCRIERGHAEPSISLLKKIAKALNARLVVRFVERKNGRQV